MFAGGSKRLEGEVDSVVLSLLEYWGGDMSDALAQHDPLRTLGLLVGRLTPCGVFAVAAPLPPAPRVTGLQVFCYFRRSPRQAKKVCVRTLSVTASLPPLVVVSPPLRHTQTAAYLSARIT